MARSASPSWRQGSRVRKFTLLIACLGAVVVYASLPSWPWPRYPALLGRISNDAAQNNGMELSCRTLQGADETLVIMRTGSTELEAKLSTHLRTTLRCTPHHLIFSDAAGTFQGHSILDAPSSVSDKIKESHPDFELYRRLRNGRSTLASNELRGQPNEAFHESWTGHTENPGWKLDKWKFLPMVNETFYRYPTGIKWYVFIEADSYIMWPSLLEHLNNLDHTQPYYSGTEVYIEDVPFAHGGSGFMISWPAMQSVVDYYPSHKVEIEEFTDGHWAGDCVLGKCLAETGVNLTSAWPILQGDSPGILPYIAPDGRPRPPIDANIWCSRAVSYHHIDTSTVEDLWHFEQEWMSNSEGESIEGITHGEVFDQCILPRIKQGQREDWDNESGTESGRDVGPTDSIDICRSWCEQDPGCVQYSVSAGRCYHFHLPRLGRPMTGVKSGWLIDQIEQLRKSVPPC